MLSDVKQDTIMSAITLLHCYPLSNEELLQKWITYNPRKDFVPTRSSRRCSLHFQSGDFINVSQDTNVYRQLMPINSKFQRY